MATNPRFLVSIFLTLMIFSPSTSENMSETSWVGSKYQIECTMCAACDNPCNPATTPPPPPSPPPPANPSLNCPPPPSPPSSGYYLSPPPPTPKTNPVASYPPPSGGTYPSPTPPYSGYPTPPPPNPIVGYFPFYYHSPPSPDSLSRKLVPGFIAYAVIAIFSFVFM